jgi:hypothetical protein
MRDTGRRFQKEVKSERPSQLGDRRFTKLEYAHFSLAGADQRPDTSGDEGISDCGARDGAGRVGLHFPTSRAERLAGETRRRSTNVVKGRSGLARPEHLLVGIHERSGVTSTAVYTALAPNRFNGISRRLI